MDFPHRGECRGRLWDVVLLYYRPLCVTKARRDSAVPQKPGMLRTRRHIQVEDNIYDPRHFGMHGWLLRNSGSEWPLRGR